MVSIPGLRPFSRSLTVCALGAVACATVIGCQRAAPAPEVVPQVGALTVQYDALPLVLTYPGHAAGSRQVEVRARVSGILLKRTFEEGRSVAQDQLLFQLDPQPARVALEQARAELAVERAHAAQAQRDADRIAAMAEQKLVSAVQQDQAQSTLQIAQANAQAAEARVRKAELELSYTEVRAPIAGLVSNEARSEGSLITAGTESSLLTRIVQADPLYIEFTVPDSEAAALRSTLSAKQAPLRARVQMADGSWFAHVAEVTFLDNAVQTQSGSVAARAGVANPDLALLPGQFVRVHVEGVSVDNVLAVPRKAVLTNSQGHYVWVLDGATVASRQVVLGLQAGDQVVIKHGLRSGDRIVVDGIMKVAAGTRVNATVWLAERGADGAVQPIANIAGAGPVKGIE